MVLPARYVWAVLALSSGCATPAFNRDLVVVDLTRAPVPVMVSRVKHAPAPEASGGTHTPHVRNEFTEPPPATQPDTIYTFENGRTTERSRTGVSEQILRRIGFDTAWVQLGELVFSARDAAWLSGGEMRRELSAHGMDRR